MRLSSPVAAIATSAVATLVLGVAPANAESWRGHDPRGDVRSFRIDLTTKCDTIPAGDPQPRDRRRDITRLSVAHGAEDVVIGMSLREVVRHDEETVYEAYVHTPDRIFDVLIVDLPSTGPVVGISTVRVGRDPECGPALVGGHAVDCEGVEADVDPRADRVSVTIPRTCLRSPRWVRVGAQTAGYDPDQFEPGDRHITIAFDAWGPKGTTPRRLLPPSGPRVRAG